MKARNKLTEIEARYYIKQVLEAVKFIHSKKVIHRDIKLGNLFLDEQMQIQLGDFGLAAVLKEKTERRFSMCGTPNYIAPEILNANKRDKRAGYSFTKI